MQYHEAWDVGAGRIGSWFISFAVLSFLGFFLSSRLVSPLASSRAQACSPSTSVQWIVDPFLPKAGEGATEEYVQSGRSGPWHS